MTVAIGLVCRDGVVVASDSMTSAGMVADQGRKVNAVQDLGLVWTASGSVYVIEEVEAAFRNLVNDANDKPQVMANFTSPNLEMVRQNLATYVREKMRKAYESAMPGVDSVPNPVGVGTTHPWASDFLVAGYAHNTPYFLELSGDGQINWHTDRRFAAVGSGGEFATVARALMEHYVEGGDLPVELGLRIAYRAIEATCRVSSAWVRVPVQLAVSSDDGASVLDEGEVAEVASAVEGWLVLERDTIRMSPDQEQPPGSEDLEEPPKLDGGS